MQCVLIKSMKKLLKTIFVVAVVGALCLSAFCCVGCGKATQEHNSTSIASTSSTQHTTGKFVSHFIDVGQGDSEFLELPDGKTMLIDTGEYDQSKTVGDYISSLGYKKIDYLVATHPHSDHIGAMADIIKTFDIGEIYAPKVSHNTKTFENFLDAVASKGLQINTAVKGTIIYDAEGLKIEILSPCENTDYDDLNDWSIILKATFDNNVFLYTGDASASVIKKAQAGEIDVLKVGHHGSKTSTSNELIESLNPKWAVIEVGANNDYGHPHSKALKALQKYGVTIYRTDQNGTCTATSDGTNITWTTSKG